MKKVFSYILCLVIIVFSAVSVCATRTDPADIYYIDELGFSIHTPLFNAATRSVNNLDISQEKYEEMLKDFEEEHIYYWGFSRLFYYNDNPELIIYGSDADINSLADISDYRLKDVIKRQISQWESVGATVVKSEMYKSYDAKYIMTHLKHGEEMYGINYYTIKNRKNIEIIMWCHDGEPVADTRQELVNMINTIKFDEPDNPEFYSKTYFFSIAENGRLTPLGESLILTGVIVLIQIIAGVVVLIILLNKRKKRRKAALAQTDLTTQPISGSPVQPALKTKFCIYCGTKLTENDGFCHVCGKSQNINSQ